MRSCQMHTLGAIITLQMLMSTPSTRNWSEWLRLHIFPPSYPCRPLLQLFGSDWMCINAYVMVLVYNACFWIVCWKLWFTIASLVYSLVSCCPVRPSIAANCGDRQLLRSLTTACGHRSHTSQVITPSPSSHTYAQVLTLKRIDYYLPAPTNVAGSLSESSSHTPYILL